MNQLALLQPAPARARSTIMEMQNDDTECVLEVKGLIYTFFAFRPAKLLGGTAAYVAIKWAWESRRWAEYREESQNRPEGQGSRPYVCSTVFTYASCAEVAHTRCAIVIGLQGVADNNNYLSSNKTELNQTCSPCTRGRVPLGFFFYNHKGLFLYA